MLGVIVELEWADGFDREGVVAIAHVARGRFERTRGLRQKAFTVDEQTPRATNVYLSDPGDAARAFFTDKQVERIAGRYGPRPTVTFVDVVEVVDNAPTTAAGR